MYCRCILCTRYYKVIIQLSVSRDEQKTKQKNIKSVKVSLGFFRPYQILFWQQQKYYVLKFSLKIFMEQNDEQINLGKKRKIAR